MDTMLSKALREFTTGPLNQLIVNLGGQDGDQWEEELKRFLRKESCWPSEEMAKLLKEREELKHKISQLLGEVAQVAEPKPILSILELVSTIVVNATTGRFVAKEKFVRDTVRRAKVKIGELGDNFIAWFLSGEGKIEDPIAETTLRYHTVLQDSVDGPIIEELGGEEKAETTLSEMFSLMVGQKHGEDGVLLNDGFANIFYIKDIAGILRSVRVFWHYDSWHVYARSIDFPDRWGGGRRVFCRLPAI